LGKGREPYPNESQAMPYIQQPEAARDLASKHRFANQHYISTHATHIIPTTESIKLSCKEQHPNSRPNRTPQQGWRSFTAGLHTNPNSHPRSTQTE